MEAGSAGKSFLPISVSADRRVPSQSPFVQRVQAAEWLLSLKPLLALGERPYKRVFVRAEFLGFLSKVRWQTCSPVIRPGRLPRASVCAVPRASSLAASSEVQLDQQQSSACQVPCHTCHGPQLMPLLQTAAPEPFLGTSREKLA